VHLGEIFGVGSRLGLEPVQPDVRLFGPFQRAFDPGEGLGTIALLFSGYLEGAKSAGERTAPVFECVACGTPQFVRRHGAAKGYIGEINEKENGKRGNVGDHLRNGCVRQIEVRRDRQRQGKNETTHRKSQSKICPKSQVVLQPALGAADTGLQAVSPLDQRNEQVLILGIVEL